MKKIMKKMAITLVGVFAGIGLSLSTAQAASISFEMPSYDLILGTDISIDVVADFSDEATVGGGFNINWNPAVLGLNSWTLSTTSGFDSGFTGTDSVDAAGGQITNTYFGNFSGLPGIFTVGTLNFTGLAVGSSSLDLSPGSTFVSSVTFSPMTVDLIGSAANVAPVPVPGAVWLFGSGLIGLVGMRRRFNK